MSLGFVFWAAALLAVGHLLLSVLLRPERRVRPAAGAAACLSLLGVRVVLSVSISILALQYAGSGGQLSWVPAWCLHMLGPASLFEAHPALGEHALVDVARLTPALLMAVLAIISIGRISQGHRSLRRWLQLNRLGEGPSGSLIVDDPEMVLAVAGVYRPVVVVSPATLLNLEEDELSAGLLHEFAHVKRRHQAVATVGLLLAGLSRLIPGGRKTFALLQYFIERDADEYAVRKMDEPSSLARAIVKLATSRASDHGLATARLASSGVPDRLGLLVDRRPFNVRIDLMLAAGALLITAIAVAMLVGGAQLLLAGSISSPHIALTSHVCA